MLSAEELHRRGVEAINAGRSRQALVWLERAAAGTGGDLAARVNASLAYVVADLGDPARALDLCEAALAETGIDPGTRGIVEAQRGLLLMREGRSEEALAAFDRAMSVLGEDRAADLGKAHLNRGGVHLQRADPEAAELDFLAASTLLARAGLPVEAAMAEHNAGYARLMRGDLGPALAAMDGARRVLAPLSPVHEATCDQDRAEVLVAAGQLDEGRRALASAARAYGARRLRRRQAEAELKLARVLTETQPSVAATTARAAARRFRRIGVEAWAKRADAVALIADVHRGMTSPALLRRADALASDLRGQGDDWIAATVDLAGVRIQSGRGDYADASRRIRSFPVGRSAPLDVRLTARGLRADLAAAAGDRRRALGHLRKGLADLHDWQSSFGSLDLQTNVIGSGVRLARRGLALALGSTSDVIVFEWSERARMLASRVQPLRAPSDPQLVADLAELRSMPDPDTERALRRRIRERSWQLAGSGQVADPVSLPELQAGLDAGSALVAYVVAAGRVVALVVTSERVVRVDLGAREPLDRLLGGLLPDLDVAATDLSGALATAVRGDLVSRLGRLAELLVAPLLAHLGDRAVVLTPSGVLAGVPWTLLSGLVGRPVTVAQSATSWLARRATPLRMRSAGFVAGPRVVRAEAEVAAAAKEWDAAAVLRGGDATAAAVSELAAGVDVLHVAAHGRHSAESPLFSGLQLVDGTWFGYDIDQLAAVPDVVLLSACEVGRSTVRWGEELIGMTAAWLHAGARCVIASPAAVADAAAYDAFVRVHRGLAEGMPPAAALATAVGAAGVEEPPAPFVCFC